MPNGWIQSVRQARPKIRDNQRKHFFLRTGPGRPAGRQAGSQAASKSRTLHRFLILPILDLVLPQNMIQLNPPAPLSLSLSTLFRWDHDRDLWYFDNKTTVKLLWIKAVFFKKISFSSPKFVFSDESLNCKIKGQLVWKSSLYSFNFLNNNWVINLIC